MRAHLGERVAPDDVRRWSELTVSELECVLFAFDGLSNAEISEVRGTSSRTTANLLARAFRRLGVAGRSELIVRYDAIVHPRAAGSVS